MKDDEMVSFSTIFQKVQQQWLYLNIKKSGHQDNFYPQSFKDLYGYKKFCHSLRLAE